MPTPPPLHLVTQATASVDTFSPSDVGSYITWFNGTGYVRSKILNYVDARTVTIEQYGSVPVTFAATLDWSISGLVKRYIERMDTRIITDQDAAFFVDAGLSFDGRNTTATTMTISGGTAWDETEQLTVTASAAAFVGATDVGDQIIFSVGDIDYRLTVEAFTSTTEVQARPNRIIPTTHRNTARTDWAWGRDTMAGLDHLEGLEVAILADGNVQPHQFVSGGKVPINPPGVRVHVGLPIQADLETLDLSVQGIETLLPKTKAIPSATVLVQDSPILQVGRSFDALQLEPARTNENYDSPINATTRKAQVRFQSTWDKTGSLVIRQDDPVPLTVLAIIPDVTQGGS